MGIVPSFFNINEPILFGMPIIMNPLFFLPFILVPMINAVFARTATKLGWVAQVVSMAPDYACADRRFVEPLTGPLAR